MRKLWFSGGSPYARTVRMLLAEKGLDYEKDQHDAVRPVEALKDLNPNLTIPVMEDGGLRLFDSKVIIEYLVETYPNAMADPAFRPRLAPFLVRPERRWEDLKTLATLETMTESIVNLRLLASSGLRSAEVEYMRRQEARIQHILDWLEADRAAVDGFMPGFFSVMDMAFIAAAAFAEARGVAPWRGRPRLEALFEHFADRPAVVSTRPVPTAAPT